MPISSAIDHVAKPVRRDCGFTLMEVVLALTIASMLATLAIPYWRAGAGSAALNAKAFEVASLLRRDRNTAMRFNRTSRVAVDAKAGVMRSASLQQSIVMPRGIVLRLLPERADGITFNADGRSSGVRIVLSTRDVSVAIDVNRVTSAIQIAGVPR